MKHLYSKKQQAFVTKSISRRNNEDIRTSRLLKTCSFAIEDVHRLQV